jgi:hypothetical protein
VTGRFKIIVSSISNNNKYTHETSSLVPKLRIRGSPHWGIIYAREYNNFSTSDWRGQSRWPRDLRRGSKADPLLGFWIRIPSEAWMSVTCECCVLSGRGLCGELIIRPEESYRLWCVWVWSRNLVEESYRVWCVWVWSRNILEESYRVWCVWVWSRNLVEEAYRVWCVWVWSRNLVEET